MDNQCGFTLMELIVVLTIIVLAAAITIPNFEGTIKNMKLKTTAREFGSTLKYARSHAISTGRDCIVNVNLTSNILTLSEGEALFQSLNTNQKMQNEESMSDNQKTVGTPIVRRLPGDIFLFFIFDNGELLDEGVVEVYFTPKGTSSGGRFLISDNQRKPFLIQINPLTGKTSVQRVNNYEWS